MSSVDDENSSTSTSSSSVTIVKPVLLRASMLRPSAFSAQLFSSSKAPPPTEDVVEETVPAATTNPVDASATTAINNGATETAKGAGEEKAEKPVEDPLSLLTKSNGLAKSNPFSAVQVTPLASSSAFVFGQNTRERVTGNVDDEEAAATQSNGDLSFSSTTAAVPEKATGSEDPSSNGEGNGADKEKGDAAASGKSLSDVAREYEENKNARKRKFEEVETFTGEEDETNVLDVTCKLYTFSQVYEERGRGSLRLNDPKKGAGCSSRLVFRTAGSLRVLLNTKIWDGMIAEPASAKSLRITGIDATGQVKVYLVMARPSDIQSLAMALKMRISAEKTRIAKGVEEGEEEMVAEKDSETNGNWDEEEEEEEEKEKSKVTPDLIADTEKKDGGDDDEEQEEDGVECLSVEVPAFKKRALDPDVSVQEETKTTEEPEPEESKMTE